jgi:hypothetical protein
MMLISEAKGKLKVGMRVRTTGSATGLCREYFSFDYVEGVIGEIQYCRFYVWQNEHDGSMGKIPVKGFKYSWQVDFTSPGTIEILSEGGEEMTKKV